MGALKPEKKPEHELVLRDARRKVAKLTPKQNANSGWTPPASDPEALRLAQEELAKAERNATGVALPEPIASEKVAKDAADSQLARRLLRRGRAGSFLTGGAGAGLVNSRRGGL